MNAATPVTRAVTRMARNNRNVYGAIRKSKIGVHVDLTVEQAGTIAGERRTRAMPKDLVPGEVLLRALLAVIQGGDNPEPELRAAVDAFCVRARDATNRDLMIAAVNDNRMLIIELSTKLDAAHAAKVRDPGQAA